MGRQIESFSFCNIFVYIVLITCLKLYLSAFRIAFYSVVELKSHCYRIHIEFACSKHTPNDFRICSPASMDTKCDQLYFSIIFKLYVLITLKYICKLYFHLYPFFFLWDLTNLKMPSLCTLMCSQQFCCSDKKSLISHMWIDSKFVRGLSAHFCCLCVCLSPKKINCQTVMSFSKILFIK